MKHTFYEYLQMFYDSAFFTGFVGAFTSMLLPNDKMNFWRRAAYIIVGAMVAGYLSPLVIDLLGIENKNVSNAIVFVIGMLGMLIVGGLAKIGKDFKENPIETWKRIKSIFPWKKR